MYTCTMYAHYHMFICLMLYVSTLYGASNLYLILLGEAVPWCTGAVHCCILSSSSAAAQSDIMLTYVEWYKCSTDFYMHTNLYQFQGFWLHCRIHLLNRSSSFSVPKTNSHHTATIKHCLKYNKDTLIRLLRQPATDNCLSFITHHRGGENISELLAPSYW